VYLRTPFACTIVSWSIASTTAETDTVALWRVATGHGAPHLQQLHQHGRRVTYLGHGRLLNDFDGFHLYRNRANDWLAASLTAVTASHFVNYTLGASSETAPRVRFP